MGIAPRDVRVNRRYLRGAAAASLEAGAVEHYVNWLAGLHATSAAGAAVDVDLSPVTTGFSSVSPTYVVSGAKNGTVTLASGSTARFQPTAGFRGLASFTFTVTGSDGSAYTSEVVVLVTS